jgi:hypothetical protein
MAKLCETSSISLHVDKDRFRIDGEAYAQWGGGDSKLAARPLDYYH